MKKQWITPKLEILDLSKTMGHTNQMQSIDKDYEAGTLYEDLTWS